MKKAGGACKFLGIIFILSLLVQGSCGAESTNTGSTDTLNGTINGTINGKIIGTINNPTNNPTNNTQAFQGVLLLPIFLGSLLFLCWMCRFFDKMNFCFVIFIALLMGFLSFNLILTKMFDPILTKMFDPILTGILYIPIALIIIFIVIVISYEMFKQRERDESNLIMWIHDIVRNFIVILTVLIWPMILLYFHIKNVEYVTLYGIEKLKFPVYLIAASFIGILSYLFLSIEENFNHLIPEFKKIGIAWSYLKRILIAPFIALIGFYLLNHLQNINEIKNINDYFVFVFSFFSGVFTKTIETWIYSWVQKLLPEYKKDEFDARDESRVKKSDFVKKLRFDKDLAYALYNARIRTIEELAVCDAEELANKLNLDTRNLGEGSSCFLKKSERRIGSYSINHIKLYINKAKDYIDMDKSEFVTKLKMDRDLAFKLYYFANIKTIEDLKDCNPKEVHDKICDCKNEAELLANRERIAIEKAHEMLCGCSEEKIKKLKEKAQKELESKKEKIKKLKEKAQKESESKSDVDNHQDKENEDHKKDQ